MMKNKILYIMLVVLIIYTNNAMAQKTFRRFSRNCVPHEQVNEAREEGICAYAWLGANNSLSNFKSFGAVISLNKHQLILGYNVYTQMEMLQSDEMPNKVYGSYNKSVGYGYKFKYTKCAFIPSMHFGTMDGVWSTYKTHSYQAGKTVYEKEGYTNLLVTQQIEFQKYINKHLGISMGVMCNFDITKSYGTTYCAFIKVLVGVVR